MAFHRKYWWKIVIYEIQMIVPYINRAYNWLLSRNLSIDFFKFQTNINLRYTWVVKMGFLNPIYPNVKEWLYIYLKKPQKAVCSKWSSVKKNYNFTFVNVTRMYLYIYVQEYYWPLWFKTSCALENIVSFCRSIWLYNTPLRCLNGNVCGTFFLL